MTAKQAKTSLNFIPALVAILLVFAMPRLEDLVFPVVRDFAVVGVHREPSAITINGYLRKVRDCTFVGVQAITVDSTGHGHDAPLIFLDTPNNNIARPTGTQTWGPWRVTIKTDSDAESVRLTATHRCHWVYANDTDLINIPLKGIE